MTQQSINTQDVITFLKDYRSRLIRKQNELVNNRPYGIYGADSIEFKMLDNKILASTHTITGLMVEGGLYA